MILTTQRLQVSEMACLARCNLTYHTIRHSMITSTPPSYHSTLNAANLSLVKSFKKKTTLLHSQSTTKFIRGKGRNTIHNPKVAGQATMPTCAIQGSSIRALTTRVERSMITPPMMAESACSSMRMTDRLKAQNISTR